MDEIKFLYFDVGGVSIIDFSGNNKWEEMIRSFGVTDENKKHFDLVWGKYENRLCTDCDIDTIVPEFRQVKGISMPEEYSMLTDFVQRFERNHSIMPVIENAKGKYRVGLLTNMYPRMLEAIKEYGLLPELEWDAIIDSSVVGHQKPDPHIYEIAEKMAGVKPEEIFFIDNSNQNIQMAQERGWNTFLYDPQKPEESSRHLAESLGLEV